MPGDCYARFEKENGLLCIGNSAVEKLVRLSGSCICTLRITDKLSGAEWAGDALKWQRCPVLRADESPKLRFETRIVADHPLMAPHLKATLELSGENGSCSYEYTVFPGIPFVFMQAFAENRGADIEENETAVTLNSSGNESLKPESAESAVLSDDTLDCIPLGNRHLEVETFTLYDKTDINDSLVERQTVPVYRRGLLEREGNIFRISDIASNDSLLLIKHAPTPSSALNRRGKDLIVREGRHALLMGTGVDFRHMPREKIPYYACAVGAAKTDRIMEALHAYSTAFSSGDPRKSLFVMSNTWGDRSQDMAVSESFILDEIEAAHRVGADIVQIDDGWQTGVTVNSLRKAGGVWEGYYSENSNFWAVNAERFPRGLWPLIEKTKAYNMELGLWFSPDSSNEFANYEKDIETLFALFNTYGIRYFKLDGVKIRSKLCEKRFAKLLETLTLKSGGEIRFNLDVTAEDRFGYLYYPQYGTLFVENRYTDWGNYFPHNTFKNLWALSAVLPTRRLQMELLNKNRNKAQYAGMAFAPENYGMDYLFASVLPANPLLWMEVSHLPAEDAAVLSKITSVYREYKQELFSARVMPIGEAPCGRHFTGWCIKNADGRSGHLLLFREETETAEYAFSLPVSLEGASVRTLYESAPAAVRIEKAAAKAAFSDPRAFIWLRYEK